MLKSDSSYSRGFRKPDIYVIPVLIAWCVGYAASSQFQVFNLFIYLFIYSEIFVANTFRCICRSIPACKILLFAYSNFFSEIFFGDEHKNILFIQLN